MERSINKFRKKNWCFKIEHSICSLALCGLAFLVLINFNMFTILMALISMPLAFTYPLMKRLTYWPQLFLGITFNYGLVLAWISITNEISSIPILFYIGAIFWTLGYDTIYGFQDIKDDEIIGVKSTSIKFKNDPKKFLYVCYFLFIISIFVFSALLISKAHDDFSYYHLSFTKYLTENKIIFGLGHLNHGYNLLSSLFFLNSTQILDFSPFIIMTTYLMWDTVRVMIVRINKNKSPFLPDRNHFHFILLDSTKKHYLTIIFILFFNINFFCGSVVND